MQILIHTIPRTFSSQELNVINYDYDYYDNTFEPCTTNLESCQTQEGHRIRVLYLCDLVDLRSRVGCNFTRISKCVVKSLMSSLPSYLTLMYLLTSSSCNFEESPCRQSPHHAVVGPCRQDALYSLIGTDGWKRHAVTATAAAGPILFASSYFISFNLGNRYIHVVQSWRR